jgi:FKBP-type peptidyl-prolyl cis-trans isomerase
MSRYLLFLIAVFALTMSCKNRPRESFKTLKEEELMQSNALIEWNKELVAEHDRFLQRIVNTLPGTWSKTENGIYYRYSDTDSAVFTLDENDKVTLNYRLKLMNDSVVERAQISVVVDKNELPSGFNYGIKLARNVGRVELIVPFYLAYGVKGYVGKVAPLQPVKFEFEIIDIEKR